MYSDYERKIENLGQFPISCSLESFPDVMFHVFYEEVPSASLVKQTVMVMQNFMSAYNFVPFLQPIHYVSDVEDATPEDEDPYAVHIHVDFGNCKPKAVIKAVEMLDRAALPIVKLVLD